MLLAGVGGSRGNRAASSWTRARPWGVAGTWRVWGPQTSRVGSTWGPFERADAHSPAPDHLRQTLRLDKISQVMCVCVC